MFAAVINNLKNDNLICIECLLNLPISYNYKILFPKGKFINFQGKKAKTFWIDSRIWASQITIHITHRI